MNNEYSKGAVSDDFGTLAQNCCTENSDSTSVNNDTGLTTGIQSEEEFDSSTMNIEDMEDFINRIEMVMEEV